MDSLLLKIICTAITLIVLISICLSVNVSRNKIYKQSVTDTSRETPCETHLSSNFGMRAEIKTQIDNSASPGAYIDSNPE